MKEMSAEEEIEEIKNIVATLKRRTNRVIQRANNGYFSGGVEGYSRALDYCTRLRARITPYRENLKPEIRELERHRRDLREGRRTLTEFLVGSRIAEALYTRR